MGCCSPPFPGMVAVSQRTSRARVAWIAQGKQTSPNPQFLVSGVSFPFAAREETRWDNMGPNSHCKHSGKGSRAAGWRSSPSLQPHSLEEMWPLDKFLQFSLQDRANYTRCGSTSHSFLTSFSMWFSHHNITNVRNIKWGLKLEPSEVNMTLNSPWLDSHQVRDHLHFYNQKSSNSTTLPVCSFPWCLSPTSPREIVLLFLNLLDNFFGFH